MDSAYCINADAKPKDGDPGVCSVCGKVMVYEGGSVRKPTLDEMVEFLMIEEFLVAMIAAGRMVRLKKSRLN